MELKVLGCHGGETPRHRTSSFLIDDQLAIDAGAITSTLSLEAQQKIEAVLVSHAHLDHVRDLATLADNRCQQGGPALQIVGTAATLDALKRHFFNDTLWPDFSRIQTGIGPIVEFQALEPEVPTKVLGRQVQAILVSHTIETAGFLVRDGKASLAYSGDTGPTERLWDFVNAAEDLRGLLMEVSFPNDEAKLAAISGHHTPATLRHELKKLRHSPELPIFLYHIKPVFEAVVERELAKDDARNLTVLRLEDTFIL